MLLYFLQSSQEPEGAGSWLPEQEKGERGRESGEKIIIIIGIIETQLSVLVFQT